MAVEKQPGICFQVVSNWNIGRKPVYSALFPANFRSNFLILKTGAPVGGGSRYSRFALLPLGELHHEQAMVGPGELSHFCSIEAASP